MRLITTMNLCLCRPSGDSAGERERRGSTPRTTPYRDPRLVVDVRLDHDPKRRSRRVGASSGVA